ncbi:unnamed protein product, partial [Candidula unifasciata]
MALKPQIGGSIGASRDETAAIFVLPYKIQRKRLEDIKHSMLKKNIPLAKALDHTVTHIVTEFESLEQVEKQAAKDGLQLPTAACVVSMGWLVECLKASAVLPVEESHLFKKDALEVLQLHAELKDGSQDYSRALAFRRASCLLKSLPFEVRDPRQLSRLKDIGGHVLRVVTDILDNGSSKEVEDIVSSKWFQQMKMFTSIFGVGSATAKSWISKGWTTIEDVRGAGCPSSDWRVVWGLAFYEDLGCPVSRQEADTFVAIVHREAEAIWPGTIVTCVGGFRRGKEVGHDVDLLITHPREGEEVGLLPKLLSALAKRDLILIGHREKNSY